jgi:hypothetical protein
VARGTNQLPSREYATVPGVPHPALPQQVPGGQWGTVALPSRIDSMTTDSPSVYGGYPVPGGISGPRANISRIGPVAVPQTAPFPFTGVNNGGGGPLRNAGGGPITWWRKAFPNMAGQSMFNTGGQATPSWTSNTTATLMEPGSPIPYSIKRQNFGGYRREQFVDTQLYPILPRWIIQRGVRNYVKGWASRPATNPSYQNRLTSYAPAGSFGSTTPTLQSQLLTNLLSSTQNQYGAY